MRIDFISLSFIWSNDKNQWNQIIRNNILLIFEIFSFRWRKSSVGLKRICFTENCNHDIKHFTSIRMWSIPLIYCTHSTRPFKKAHLNFKLTKNVTFYFSCSWPKSKVWQCRLIFKGQKCKSTFYHIKKSNKKSYYLPHATPPYPTRPSLNPNTAICRHPTTSSR